MAKKWIQKAHLKKGSLHRWAGVRSDKKFTVAELSALERCARWELREAHADGDKREAGRALHHLRMVLFAKRARGFGRKKKGYGKKK